MKGIGGGYKYGCDGGDSGDDCNDNEECDDYGEGGYGEGDYGEDYGDESNDDDECDDGNYSGQGSGRLKFIELQNFLKHQSLTLFNLTPKDSSVSFEVEDLSHYSQLYVLAFDNDTFA